MSSNSPKSVFKLMTAGTMTLNAPTKKGGVYDGTQKQTLPLNGAKATVATNSGSHVDRILARIALEGDPLRFIVKLKKASTTPISLKFDWQKSKNIYSQAALDLRTTNGDILTHYFSNGVKFSADKKSVIVPAGVSEFTLFVPTKKDGKSEAPEYLGITLDKVSGRTAVSSDIPFDNAKWWRTESWFSGQIFGSASVANTWLNTWLNPKSIGMAKVANPLAPLGGPPVDYATFIQSFIGYDPKVHKITKSYGRKNFNMQPWTQVYTALADLLQLWYTGGIKYAANAPQALRPGVKAQFTANAVVFTNPNTGKVVNQYKKPAIIQQPNRKQIIVLGDSVTDEDMWQGSFVNSLRTDVEPKGWDVLNLATGAMATSGLNGKMSGALFELSAIHLLKNQLLINPTPGVVIMNLGTNSIWRNISPTQLERDLRWLVNKALASGAKVLLSSNIRKDIFGKNYKAYASAFAKIAKEFKGNSRFSYIPDFYAPIANMPSALVDRVHPAPLKAVQDALYSSFKKVLFPNERATSVVNAELLASDNDEFNQIYDDKGGAQLDISVLDLNGQGLQFSGLDESAAQFDAIGDGSKNTIAWVKGGTALLALDTQGDGIIDQTDEISFVDYEAGAQTNLEGLQAFDTNGDGKLSALDRDWHQFGVWADANSDGQTQAGEFKNLESAGIASIDLHSSGQRSVAAGGDVTVFGTTAFTWADGRTGAVGDVSLAYGAATQSLIQALAAFAPPSPAAQVLLTPSYSMASSPALAVSSN